MSDARKILDAQISEAEFMKQIIDLATLHGWLVAHVPDALYRLAGLQGKYYMMAGAKGLPDLILAKPGSPKTGWYPVVFLECKAARGRVKPEQQQWLDALDQGEALRDYIVARVVRPSDWDSIVALLSGEQERMTA